MSKLDAIDLHIGDRVAVRAGLQVSTRTVDIVGYKKNSVEIQFTDGSVRTFPNQERMILR